MPLFFEIIFFAVLTAQTAQLEIEVDKEYRAKRILQLVGGMTELVYEVVAGASQLSAGRLEQSAQFRDTVNEVLTVVPNYRAQLMDLIKDNPRDRETFKPFDECYARALVLFRKISDQIEKGMEPRQALYAVGELKVERESLLERYTKSVKSFITQYKNIEKSSPQRQRRMRNQQKNVLLLGLLMNIVIAVLLVLYFARSITGRLKIMTANTVLLAKRQPLNPPISGSDEIAQLDAVFHQMADELAEAGRRKKEFMSVASHDIRSPLTSVLGNLVLFNHGSLGEVPMQARDKMLSTESNVRKLITLIGDLIEFDKLETAPDSMKMEVVLVESLFDKAIQIHEKAAEKLDVELDIDLPDGELAVLADTERSVQVISSLINNCLNFVSAGDRILCSAVVVNEDVEFRILQKNRVAAQELHEIAFERDRGEMHSSVKQVFGPGLALPLCKLIIEYQGGKIGVRSVESGGILFWFSLKACKASLAAAESAYKES
ncbi:MAG: HAMP domain-containing histidine kinase [Candidatus Obscuribacterales bacterium]|nr:HAMP domain-containing histidine kinase [Candidatus Obscuribacterales bacterium]